MKEEKRTQIMQKTAVVWFGALVCCALWGSAFPCIKIGYQMFEIDAADTAAQILFAGYRFTLAGILTVLIGSVLNKGFLISNKDNRNAYVKSLIGVILLVLAEVLLHLIDDMGGKIGKSVASVLPPAFLK